MNIVTKANERNTKHKPFKARCCCDVNVIVMYLSSSKCFIFCFTHWSGQKSAKYDPIAALNTNAGDFINFSAFLTLYLLKIFLTSVSSI